jgi:hypothetical protein
MGLRKEESIVMEHSRATNAPWTNYSDKTTNLLELSPRSWPRWVDFFSLAGKRKSLDARNKADQYQPLIRRPLFGDKLSCRMSV